MCDCLNKIVERASKNYSQNGYDACVQASIKGEVSIAQYVIERDPYREKCVRLSKHRKHEGIEFNYCPVCGEKREGYQYAQVWDYKGPKDIGTTEDAQAKPEAVGLGLGGEQNNE